MLRGIRHVWHGDKDWSGVLDARGLWPKLPYALLLASLLVFGCFPRLLTDNIKASVAPVAQQINAEPTK
jgi:NADH:ubiquinone oxidoreductase subunit 4 (subunit M)